MIEFLKRFFENSRQTAAFFLSVTAIAGSILFISFIYPPSEADQQFLLGLSFARFMIGAIFLLFLFVNVVMVFLSMRTWWSWQKDAEEKTILWISNNIVLVLSTVSFAMVIVGALLLLMIPPIPISLVFLAPVRIRLLAPIIWMFLLSCLLFILIRWSFSEKIHEGAFIHSLDRILLAVGIFLFTFVLYEHIAAWIGWVNKTKYSYWNLLAEEFLNGRLYLRNQSPNPHDLTLYNGNWYVPSPPMPAILMMPLAYIIGGENISTADFSMFFSAVNAALIFLIFDQLIRRRWVTLTRNNSLWLVLLFVFGTPHLWVGISGRFWFVSQILTVTFLCLATLSSLKSWSAWIVGIFIGMAVATRPNGLMTWFFVFAIAMQIMKEQNGQITLRQMIDWSIKSLIPIGIAVAGLLFYNHARFDNFLDFGYVTINGDVDIVESARTYGLFSTHYIPYNLRVMFLYIPRIDWGNRWPILPSGAGMSIFLTTPPLIYLFHRYQFKWWILGAWLSIIFNFFLLILYHNTGRDQFGYRYILDMMVPIIVLMAVTFGKKIPWHFISLLILSIVINLYGANWFMNG